MIGVRNSGLNYEVFIVNLDLLQTCTGIDKMCKRKVYQSLKQAS